MALVNYSSSDEDDVEQNEMIGDRKLLQLPNMLKLEPDNIAAGIHATDSFGKVRRFPHERGNWATYIYIPWEPSDFSEKLQHHFIDIICNRIKTTCNPCEDIHLSISKTVILKHHWITEFIQSIQQTAVNFPRFILELNRVNIYCNDDATRTFISLDVANSNHNQIKRLVQQIDHNLLEFNLERFYEEASFHVSILWCAGDKKSVLWELQSELQTILDEFIAEDCTDFQTIVKSIECKCGNKLYNLPLS